MPADQQVKEIDIAKLTLWTENPRDPIDATASDQDVVDRALYDPNSKWTLSKLAKEMGSYYDFSELPTVVFHEGVPVVYDGNRRMILAKAKHGCVTIDNTLIDDLPTIPRLVPCNVCTKTIALQNVLRKHGDSGSWSPLDRDIFLHKFLNKEKSTLLKLEDNTGLISGHSHLNKVFVKKEILNADKLQELGFQFDDDALVTPHSAQFAKHILEQVSDAIAEKRITTRLHRGEVFESLDKPTRQQIESNKGQPLKRRRLHIGTSKSKTSRRTPRTKSKGLDLFGGPLYLKKGLVNDLYRYIVAIYEYYITHKNILSSSFPGLVRMSLRLLCETAANDLNIKIERYLEKYFDAAKSQLDKDTKTTLSSENVRKKTIPQLLHIGAHSYSAAKNLGQTVAISVIIGSMLKTTHGKSN